MMTNLNITEQIKSIDLVPVVEAAGVELQKRGNNHTGLCPFHADRSPSFVVYPNNRWWCYSDNFGGDACDFIQRLHGCNFIDACRYLGVESGKYTAGDQQQIAAAKRKKAEKARRRRYESDLIYTIGTLLRWTRKAMTAVKPSNLEEFARVIDRLPYLQYVHDVLIFGSPEEKREVFAAFRDFQIIDRNRLFKDGFDYRAWLREFSNGATNGRKVKFKT